MRVDSIEQALVDAGLTGELGPLGYAAAYAVAGDQLTLGCAVVADSVNPIELTRAAWRDVAARAGARLVEVELTCSDRAEHRRRVTERVGDIARLRAAELGRRAGPGVPPVGARPVARHGSRSAPTRPRLSSPTPWSQRGRSQGEQ